jgi:hypothetical protein
MVALHYRPETRSDQGSAYERFTDLLGDDTVTPTPSAPRGKAKKAPAKAAAPKTAKKAAAKAETTVKCEAPGCDVRFVPHPPLRKRQRFCSDACRQREFYWSFKKKHGGQRYAAVMGFEEARTSRQKAATRKGRAKAGRK